MRHFEQENRNLREKVEILCKAAESPGSKLALKRMLERFVLFSDTVKVDRRLLSNSSLLC